MTPIDICNRALLEIGSSSTITGFTTDTPAAKACTMVYESARDELLEMHPWGFALKRRVLALSTETVSGYDYAYTYPADCLHAWDIRVAEDPTYDSELIEEPIQITPGRNVFEVVASSTTSGKLIATSIQNAEVIYTARVTVPEFYSRAFIAALVYLIAMRIAPLLSASDTTTMRVAQMYPRAVRAALVKDAREGTVQPQRPNSYVDARS